MCHNSAAIIITKRESIQCVSLKILTQMNITENIMMNGIMLKRSPLFQTWEHPRIPLNRLNPRRCMTPHRVRTTGILRQIRAKLRDSVLC